jgi:hypothetical protein
VLPKEKGKEKEKDKIRIKDVNLYSYTAALEAKRKPLNEDDLL